MPVTEDEVGIQCYINNSEKFTGILRHRYTDFKVNEVDLDGNVVRLTTMKPPDAPIQQEEFEQPATVEGVVDNYARITDTTTDAASVQQLKEFLEAAESNRHDSSSNPAPSPLLLGPFKDKDQRRLVHQLFKLPATLPQFTTTTEAAADGSGSCVLVTLDTKQGRQAGNNNQQGGSRGQKRKQPDRRMPWPGGDKRYVRFAMYKENMDSHHALTSLAKSLHVSHKLFTLGGTKDKRAVTVQHVTAFNLTPQKLATQHVRGLWIGNFEFVKERMRLGDLRGNKFELILRSLETSSENSVKEAAESLKSKGFINYFGLQRFGTSDVPTHKVGIALFKGDWKGAARLILTPSSDTRPEIKDACYAYLDRNDITTALSVLPLRCVAERAILQQLKQPNNSGNYLKALLSIPHNLRTMYIHAYQSYLWNKAVSHRAQQPGGLDKVAAGDLVISREEFIKARVVRAQQAQQDGSTPDDNNNDNQGVDDIVDEKLGGAEPHIVTEEEAAAGTYSIEDLVLPLPGGDVIYPNNNTADVYSQLAAEDGVELHKSMHNVKEFSIMRLPGAYRHVILRPADFEYSVIRYENQDAELNDTDLSRLQGKAFEMPPEGNLLALKLAFTLPPSCYATMLIRELTKMETSRDFAKSLPHS